MPAPKNHPLAPEVSVRTLAVVDPAPVVDTSSNPLTGAVAPDPMETRLGVNVGAAIDPLGLAVT